MKKYYMLLFSIITVVSMSVVDSKGNLVYAANPEPVNNTVAASDHDRILELERQLAQANEDIAMLKNLVYTHLSLTGAAGTGLKVADSVYNTNTNQRPVGDTGNVSLETYTSLKEELMHVGDRGNHVSHKVNIDGDIRYHYALNSGPGGLGRNSSGIRVYLGFDSNINKDWRIVGLLESDRNLLNYRNEESARLALEGKIGKDSMLKAGSFSYLMAEGNVYDSRFTGVKADFGKQMKYSFGFGKTDDTKHAAVATARYENYDYNLETGVYHSQRDYGLYEQNTIWTFGGNYNFSNFGIGAMYLRSSLKDGLGNDHGYVLGLRYGELQSWKPGTYEIFAKYYNQPETTYIAHGINGVGEWMRGFKGYGFGTHSTLAKDFVGGLEYYDLKDKITGEKGKTWWGEVIYYF